MNIKKLIASKIKANFENVNLEDLIIESVSADKGDFSLPCFTLAKELKQNPVKIAETIAESIEIGDLIEKCEVMGGYLNFFLKKEELSKEILEKFSVSNFKSNEGEGKTICIDYGSPNLAKYLHIGHLKTLIIGESFARLFENFGYTVKRLNYIGDYGTPFGKIIGGMQEWGSMEDVEKRGNDALQEYYVKFNAKEAEDETYSQKARDIFKKIEDKDPEVYPIYEKVIEIGLKEAMKMFDILGLKFDDYRGEMYYNQFMPEIKKMLEDKNLLIDSQGAKIVDLQEYGLTPAVLFKTDGASLYTSRDICAVIDRHKEYNFDKMIYVTDVAQKLNFQQLFKIMELAGFDFYKDMEHIGYGRFSLPDGKIASRKGKQAVLEDLLKLAQDKATEIIKDRKFLIENPEDVAKKVARGALSFAVLKVEQIKDCVFDVDKAFSFEGETSPYMQYTYTRLESILRKYEKKDVKPDFSWVNNEAFELIKQVNGFGVTMKNALEKRDISIITKRVMELCKAFNKFYTTTKVLDGNDATTKAKIMLVKALRDTMKIGFEIICIDTMQEM
ncbi:MAG: arginine--tRNA ligase [Clostridiales bacterium]|nr:arginine--tRNA ligase [Clostridiales bacterium]